ncbi:shikimate dehydrogenase family protein [Pseudomonas sp. LRF_L74]|uniref:shikimate dehydrogenase family protein n=1 Tax=Pseudomonas sp. LRF_L74 TaxID=3369422 RepID=UPI003F60FCDC
MIRGSTELVAIVGSPIVQVKSPDNFNAWFAAQGKDLAMLPIDLRADALDAFVLALRGWQNIRGVVVTVPHKQAFASRIDELSPRARLLGAVNVIRREADGRLIGDHVDGDGFIGAARQNGFEAAGKRAVVIGAGGVGSAIAYTLCQEGVTHLTLSDVSPQRLGALLDALASAFPAVTFSTDLQTLAETDLLANATPIGMGGTGELPLPQALLDSLPASAHVADVVTSPEITPLLAFAQARGCSIQTGPQMARAEAGPLGHFMGVTPLQL